MITQLELFTPTTTDRYPATTFIDVPFEWVRLDYLLSLPSVDFHEDGLSTEFNREIKRSDWNYEALLNDIAENGYMNPVFVYGEDNGFYPGKETLGNGHHRVVAAFDLGYTHVPVTRDEDDQWTESGVTTR
jgi:hypothetical protein